LQSFWQDLHRAFVTSKFQILPRALLNFYLQESLMLFTFLVQILLFTYPTTVTITLLLLAIV